MKNNKVKIIMMIVLLCLLILTIVGCTLQTGLPTPKVPVASRILDSSGKLITTLGNYYRIPVKQNEMSPYIKKAIVAVEDERFYKHLGVDPIGLVRAAYRNLRAQKVVEGGSTITQQLAKNLYLTHERTFNRKIKEAYYALLLERNYTKEEILNKYLNTVYFGEGCYGVEAAADKFFNKKAIDLTLAESAMLAGFVKAPSFYSNPENIEASRERQKLVLQKMQQLNYISDKEYHHSINKEIEIMPVPQPVSKAGYFVAELLRQLERELPSVKDELYTGGLQIETTLDVEKQKMAEKAVNEKLKNKDKGLQAALVAINPANGHVEAMVGGRDYKESQFNRALASRQPGSAFKPFVYASALEHGYTAASTFFCGPVEYKKKGRNESYKPKDYKDDYHNRHFTLKEALKISDNVVAVKLNVQIGPRKVADLARRMGIKSKLDPYESLALGTSEVSPLEMARSYSAFANGGILVEPIYYTRVLDKDGNVITTNRSKLTRVLDENHAYIITDMLKSVLEPGGTAGHLIINGSAAGKTGTTDQYHDAWFVGYTTDISVAVYVGYDKNEEKVEGVGTGGSTAGPIWQAFIKDTFKKDSVKDFKKPRGIVFKKVCTRDGLLASPASTDVIKVALEKGTEPIAYCTGDIDWEDSLKDTNDRLDKQKADFSIPWEKIIPWNKSFTFN